MTYRIKVIEYESGRKEYVPQVRRWFGWWENETFEWSDRSFCQEWINWRMNPKKDNQVKDKSVTYKTVQP